MLWKNNKINTLGHRTKKKNRKDQGPFFGQKVNGHSLAMSTVFSLASRSQ